MGMEMQSLPKDMNGRVLFEHKSHVNINRINKHASGLPDVDRPYSTRNKCISFKLNTPFMFYIKDDLNLYFIGHFFS